MKTRADIVSVARDWHMTS